ncbi:MAG: DNA translocase FtsK, partial [Clostridiales bacterium]|nr:DNA translocase FtsK [Clostridiales bacterium]
PRQDAQGFYPVQPDLYDERFPLNDSPAAPAWPAQQQELDVPLPDMPAPVFPAQEPDRQQESEAAPPRFRRRRYHEQQTEEKSTAAARPAAAVPAALDARKTEARERAAAAGPAQPQQLARVRPDPVKASSPDFSRQTRPLVPARPSAYHQEEMAEADDLPWELPEKETPPSPRPAARPNSRPAAAGDWAAQVQKKQAEIDGKMPAHTTAKGEPQPVYTDPVMPITGERIQIAPRAERSDPQAKLDGTSAPKVKQSSMGMNVPYQAPPIRLLSEGRHIPQENMTQEDERRAQIIENTLRSFAVESEVKQIMHGPAITRFAIQIAPGVKVSRVANTADNLALELKSKHVRVEAPIQGTSYIGIEVPNQVVSTVSLREVLDSPEMAGNPSPLLVALGKDIAGSPILCDLSKMPHLLIAGATGSGKSVCINSIVCSLLYRTSPEQVRMIMIDPKQVELSVYNAIPHLLVPVVSDPRKAAGALSWVVQEMLERYGKFSTQGVRNLAGFNKLNQGTDQVLPNIVVIIDEMADLMEVCRKDVEESIRRLAALARAAGIYMVLATQRPSVDVITGVIKNNIPSRIAFAVSSGTDSRTIIDINGAEKLMGKGDMLYKPAGTSPIRVQGCFVSDEEVNAVADYIASRYQTNYDPNITEHLDSAGREDDGEEAKGFDDGLGGSANGGNEGEFQDLLQQAIEMAVEDGQTSTSMLQRRLRVGYARAGRLIDEMEKRGIISQSEGSKPRKTIITREQYYELFRDA